MENANSPSTRSAGIRHSLWKSLQREHRIAAQALRGYFSNLNRGCVFKEFRLQQTLLQRVAAGELEAVQQCIDRYGSLVWSLVRRSLGNHGDAEDAAQEIFIELWSKADRYDPAIATEATFIAMITRRRLIDRQRKKGRSPLLSEVGEASAVAPAALHADAEIHEEAQRANEALRRLRPEQQQVLQLSICSGWSHEKIAEHLGVPLGTVKTHIRRGLLKVRELLGVEPRGAAMGVLP